MIIDLKNCEIYLEDGYSEVGAVNLMAGYVLGATSMVVDGITGVVPVGARFSVDGHGEYTVTSTSETTGNTTTLNFTPGLLAAVADNDVITIGGRALIIKVGSGTVSWSEKKPREYLKDRGVIDSVRNADEEPMDVNLEFMYEELTASDPVNDPPTPEDVIKQRGAAADWVSADQTDPCAPYCVNISILHTPLNCTSVDREKVKLPKFYYEALDHDPKAGAIKVSGKCNATEATVTRLASA